MGRSPCCDKDGLKKGPWTPEEDQKLIHYIQLHGPSNWRSLPKNAGLERCGKSCRLRWTNYLRPDIRRGRFAFEEEETIIQLHSILGNKWSAIAARLPGRTDNEVKNYWNTHIKKRLLKMGIDPVTHAPRMELSAQINLSNLLGLQALVNPQLLSLLISSLSPIISDPQMNHQVPNQLQVPSCTPAPPDHHMTQPIIQTGPNNVNNAICPTFGWQDKKEIAQFLPNPNQSMASFENVNGKKLALDSNTQTNWSSGPLTVLAPTSSTSSTTHMNNNIEEDERDCYSSMFKFEIPESFDMDSFFLNY